MKKSALHLTAMAAQEGTTPYVVASTPRPLDPEHGQTRVAQVFGLKNSKKRKRHEISVGVDGEGLSVYDVQ